VTTAPAARLATPVQTALAVLRRELPGTFDGDEQTITWVDGPATDTVTDVLRRAGYRCETLDGWDRGDTTTVIGHGLDHTHLSRLLRTDTAVGLIVAGHLHPGLDLPGPAVYATVPAPASGRETDGHPAQTGVVATLILDRIGRDPAGLVTVHTWPDLTDLIAETVDVPALLTAAALAVR
jgi:hypothetical protein